MFILNILNHIITIIALPVFAVLIMLVYLASLFQKGPFIFAHERVGKSGKKFYLLKIRTMKTDANSQLEQVIKTNKKLAEQWAREQKLDDDPRVTRIGKLLRKTRLDELPQIFNVIKGDMVWVGPRAVTANELEKYGSYAKYYLALNPGITGLWQTNKYGFHAHRHRGRYDKFMKENMTIRLQCYIVLRTVTTLMRMNGK